MIFSPITLYGIILVSVQYGMRHFINEFYLFKLIERLKSFQLEENFFFALYCDREVEFN